MAALCDGCIDDVVAGFAEEKKSPPLYVPLVEVDVTVVVVVAAVGPEAFAVEPNDKELNRSLSPPDDDATGAAAAAGALG